MGIKAKYPPKTGRKEKRMPRPRKPLAAQTGHLTKETQETRKYEESLVNAGKDELENIPVALFLDAVAKKEYKRTLENLRKIDLINNLDRAALISYANSYAISDCAYVPPYLPVVAFIPIAFVFTHHSFT